jgi:polar amino acid transport system substrate-binding protein
VNKTFFLTTLLLILSNASISKELNFGTIHYCPFVCKDSKKPGLMIEIAQEIFKGTKYKVNLRYMSLKRAMDKNSQHMIDGFILGSRVHFKENYFPKVPTLSQPIYFFTNKNSKWKFKNTASLNKISISAIESFNYMNEEVNEFFKKSKNMTWLKEENAHQRAFELLKRKRVETFIGGSYSTQYLANNLNVLDQIKISSPTIGRYDNYISLNNRLKKSERIEVLNLINKKMPQLKDSGFISKILKRYGIK